MRTEEVAKMLDRYSGAISEMTLKILAPYGDQAPIIWAKIEEDVVHDALHYMADNGREFLDQNSLAIIVGRVFMKRLDIMAPNQYQKLAMRTCSLIDQADNSIPMLTNAMLGLCGEAGECADLVKKHLYQSHDLDKAHMAKELGDVAWYLAEAAEAIGYDLEDIFCMNIEKLKARYPESHFDAARSLHRKAGDV